MCENNKATTTDIGKGMDGLQHGGYQSHFPLYDWELAVKLPTALSVDIGCMLPCSGVTTYTAVQRAAESIHLGIRLYGKATVLVIGAGGLGMWTIINLKAVFGDKVDIICADINHDNIRLAKEYGACDGVVFQKDASVEDTVATVTANGKRKLDACIDIVGMPFTVKVAFFSLHNGGTLVPLGLSGGQLALPIPNVIGKTISIKGSRTGSIDSLREITDQ
jgi:propanol-preferring alcohol dehydrogenase